MNLMNSLGTGVTILVAVPFMVIVLFILLMGLRGRRLANASKRWASTTRKVLSSDVEVPLSTGSIGSYTTSYYPVIFYDYQVDGQLHRK